MSTEYISNNLQDTRKIAREVLRALDSDNGAKVICLSGDLGAGKTAFTKEMAVELGVEETVTSPTFVIMKKYQTPNSQFQTLIHIDAYRLESSAELEVLGWREMANNPKNLILIEWPENVQDILPFGAMKIGFELMDNNERRIVVDS